MGGRSARRGPPASRRAQRGGEPPDFRLRDRPAAQDRVADAELLGDECGHILLRIAPDLLKPADVGTNPPQLGDDGLAALPSPAVAPPQVPPHYPHLAAPVRCVAAPRLSGGQATHGRGRGPRATEAARANRTTLEPECRYSPRPTCVAKPSQIRRTSRPTTAPRPRERRPTSRDSSRDAPSVPGRLPHRGRVP